MHFHSSNNWVWRWWKLACLLPRISNFLKYSKVSKHKLRRWSCFRRNLITVKDCIKTRYHESSGAYWSTDQHIYRSTDLHIYKYTDQRIYRYTDLKIDRSTSLKIYRYLINLSADLQIYGFIDLQIYRSTDL